jgi:hypothetical protein
MTAPASKVLAVAIAGFVLSEPGCSRSTTHVPAQSTAPATRRDLSADEAAQLAAELANDQCERQYRKRPFAADQHSAVLEDAIYRWGGLDVGAPGGLSALVTFRRDGSETHVEVYYSTDVRQPERIPNKPLKR